MLIPGKLYRLSTDDFGASFNFVGQINNGFITTRPDRDACKITNDIMFYVGEFNYVNPEIKVYAFMRKTKPS